MSPISKSLNDKQPFESCEREGDGMNKNTYDDTTNLWGVRLYSGEEDPTGILFKGWICKPIKPLYDGEPTEPLLFRTKRQAMAWCKARNAAYQASTDHIVQQWRMRVCRVARTIEAME